jgi:hypothetical protein
MRVARSESDCSLFSRRFISEGRMPGWRLMISSTLVRTASVVFFGALDPAPGRFDVAAPVIRTSMRRQTSAAAG